METILKKIAYCYYLKFQEMGFQSEPSTDWKMAEKALNHLLRPKIDSTAWRQDEEDYGEFRKFLEGDCQ